MGCCSNRVFRLARLITQYTLYRAQRSVRVLGLLSHHGVLLLYFAAEDDRSHVVRATPPSPVIARCEGQQPQGVHFSPSQTIPEHAHQKMRQRQHRRGHGKRYHSSNEDEVQPHTYR